MASRWVGMAISGGPIAECNSARQDTGIALAIDQRGHHVPPGDAKDVAGHDRELDLGVFEEFFHSLLFGSAYLN